MADLSAETGDPVAVDGIPVSFDTEARIIGASA